MGMERAREIAQDFAESEASMAATNAGAALWLEEQRALRYRAALEGAQELLGWLNDCFVDDSCNVFDHLASDHHPGEINRRIDAVQKALGPEQPATHLVELADAESLLLQSALESHTYWEIGETHTRNDGYFREDRLDPEDEEDAEKLAEYEQVTALEAKLIAARGPREGGTSTHP